MPHRRKRRRKRHSTFGKKGAPLFIGVSLLLLVLITGVIVPTARHQQISMGVAVLLALGLWAACIFAVWACLRSRRKRRTSEYTRYPDYNAVEGSEAGAEREEHDP
jgi:uncharacterized membrane protein YbhN (UPF0104 family)